jgi:hypothetical protein
MEGASRLLPELGDGQHGLARVRGHLKSLRSGDGGKFAHRSSDVGLRMENSKVIG